MPRQDISRLKYNRSIYLKLGFLIAIGFTILAFQWEVTPSSYDDFEIEDDYTVEIIENLPPRTTPEKPLPPPTVIKTVNPEIEEIDVVFTPVPIHKPTDIITDEEPVIDKPVRVEKRIKTRCMLPPQREKIPEIEIVDFAEQMPRFPGCEEQGLSKDELKKCSDRAFFEFLGKEIRYPSMAQSVGIQGKVYVQFVVGEKGELSEIEVLRDIGAGCGTESIRVIKKMPNWVPGKQRGRPVKVRMKLPVHFKLLN